MPGSREPGIADVEIESRDCRCQEDPADLRDGRNRHCLARTWPYCRGPRQGIPGNSADAPPQAGTRRRYRVELDHGQCRPRTGPAEVAAARAAPMRRPAGISAAVTGAISPTAAACSCANARSATWSRGGVVKDYEVAGMTGIATDVRRSRRVQSRDRELVPQPSATPAGVPAVWLCRKRKEYHHPSCHRGARPRARPWPQAGAGCCSPPSPARRRW